MQRIVENRKGSRPPRHHGEGVAFIKEKISKPQKTCKKGNMQENANTLAGIREQIDEIDNQLAQLFKRRLEIVEKVAESKKASGSAVFDPARERAILTNVAEQVGEKYENGARAFFTTLFGISRARQRSVLHGEHPLIGKIKAAMAATGEKFPTKALVAVPGIEGCYAQQAASLLFSIPTIMYFHGFDKVFDAVEQGLCPYGILPIENSAAGSVAAVYDQMYTHRFHIVKALRLKVNHVLLGVHGAKLADIRQIASHPHALAQCGAFLKRHPGIKAVPEANTAVAAKTLAQSADSTRAVIASRACAELYGLDILDENIADAAFNYTRFICIAKNPEIYPDAHKFSVMMTLAHQPGALNSIISRFAAIDVNLTKLESRPIPGMDFEFRFTFDFEASPRDEAVLRLIAELADDPQIEHFTFLGAYAE